MSKKEKKLTIGARVEQLMARKRAMTYDEIVDTIRSEFTEAKTSKDSVMWYASRMRKKGKEPNIRKPEQPEA